MKMNLFVSIFSFCLEKYLEMGHLGHTVGVNATSQETVQLFQMVVPFYILTAMYESYGF